MRIPYKIVLVLLFGIAFTNKLSAQPDYPSAHWVPPTGCNKYYSSGNSHSFCVIHDMEGYYEWCISYLDRCDVDASIYYMVNGLQNGTDINNHSEQTADAVQGDITQSIREFDYAWHALCWNKYMFGTEHEGFVSNPCWYTEDMYLASARLQRYLCNKYGIAKDRNHIIGHNEWQNAAWVSWMGAHWPAINATCNNHTDPGQYWDWTHFMSLITGAPAISRQPFSQLVDSGSSPTFSATVQSVNTPHFQWFKNGTPITVATSSSLTLPNVQFGDGGSYLLVATSPQGGVSSRAATLTVSPPWLLAFADDFETNSAARWNVFWEAANGVADFTTEWAFDYSASTYVVNGVTKPIPPAPGSTGTHGLKITCNKNDSTPAIVGVSLYPKGFTFSNSYILRFDLWLNYAGGPGGTNGSSEMASCGLNHAGTIANWTGATASDGLFFTWDGEGGSGGDDYRAYQGTGSSAPVLINFANSGMSASGATRDHYSDPFFQSLFPSPEYETQGAGGKHWLHCELAYISNNIYFQINGALVAQRTNTTTYTNGTVMIGYMDPWSSISAVPQDNYAIFDNVQVYTICPDMTASALTDLTVCQGQSATFATTVTGAGPFSYVWKRNGTTLTETSSSLSIPSADLPDAGTYTVEVTGWCTNATTSATLTVDQTTTSSALTPLVLCPRNNATFSTVASGTGPFTYVWSKDSQAITTATDSSLTLNNISAADAGSYSVHVTGACNSVDQTATLTVEEDTQITKLKDISTLPNLPVSFKASTTGTGPFTYVWKKNGFIITTATTDTLDFAHVKPFDSGLYSVEVYGKCNMVTSSATLTCPPRPAPPTGLRFVPPDH